MNALTKFLAVACLGIAGTSTSRAAATMTASRPHHDSVIGSGTSDFYGAFHIDARSGPSGESPTGFVSTQGEATFSGPVTCLAVTGNVGVMNAQTKEYGLVTLQITDNAGTGKRDLIDAYPTTRATTDCSPLTFGATGYVVRGDIAVVDAVRPK